MRRRRFRASHLIALSLLAILVLCQRAGLLRVFRPEVSESHEVNRYPCELKKVVDGDTIVVRWRGKDEHVRLLDIDTPELGQPGYREAADFLRGLLKGKKLMLEFGKGGEASRDTYGRILAYVFADNRNANVEVVRAGWSCFSTEYGEGNYAEVFRQAQREARTNKRGLRAEREAPSAVPR